MRRAWIPRKAKTIDADAIDAGRYARALSMSRADSACTRRDLFRLVACYLFLFLPVHCGICWLAAHSLLIASVVVTAVSAGVFAVAIAKWLGLDEVLLRLPLVVAACVGLVAIAFIYSLQSERWWGGSDFFGVTFIVITVITLLGSAYRPASAAYQTVTMRISRRDLCVAGASMILSLGLASAGQLLHPYVFLLMTCTVAGAYAGLVLIEYAAWREPIRTSAWNGRCRLTSHRPTPRFRLPLLERTNPMTNLRW